MNIAAWSNCTKRSAEAGSSKIVTQSRDSSLKPGDSVGGGRGGSLGFNGHASNDGGIQRIVCVNICHLLLRRDTENGTAASGDSRVELPKSYCGAFWCCTCAQRRARIPLSATSPRKGVEFDSGAVSQFWRLP